MQLLYDLRDDHYHERVGSQILYWLDDLGAIPLQEAVPGEEGFLFAGARPIEDYRALVGGFPLVRDRPDERQPLLTLDSCLGALNAIDARVPMPRTWVLPLDTPLPDDLAYPLFVRTAETSWKKGGQISRVKNQAELEAEASTLRRALGWDATILAREWLNLAEAGKGKYGPIPQEVRTWIVDGIPFAWSFHYLRMLERPKGLPLSNEDAATLMSQATAIGAAFHSRLVAVDFARDRRGKWWFIEAGPGSCAGTAHEGVFKAVARRLRGEESALPGDSVGGLLRCRH